MKQKRLILLKTTSYPEVGHLYEHSYLTELRLYCSSHNLYPYLDYFVEACTYGSGIVYVTLFLYTPNAIARMNDLIDLKIDMHLLDQHLSQISLENKSKTEATSIIKMKHELSRIDSMPWKNIDSLGVLNLQDKKLPPDILQESSKPYRPTKLYVNIAIDGQKLFNDQPELLALFHQVSLFILHNIISVLCSNTSAYSSEDTFFDYGDAAALENVFYIDKTCDSVDDSLKIIRKTIEEIVSLNILSQLAKQISKSTYAEGDFYAPDDMRLYNETGLLVGHMGWTSLSTMQNISVVLSHMLIEVKTGRNYKKVYDGRQDIKD